MRKIFVIHENNDWMVPLRRELAALATPFEEWFVDHGVLDLGEAPPEGVFYNRMSASSHTRGHEHAPEYAAAVLEWLERHGRTVVNGRRALQLEVSKVAQYEALAAHEIPTPATVAVIGWQHLPEAARRVGYPLILKHNRAGKGLGVRLVLSEAGLSEALAAHGMARHRATASGWCSATCARPSLSSRAPSSSAAGFSTRSAWTPPKASSCALPINAGTEHLGLPEGNWWLSTPRSPQSSGEAVLQQ